MRPAVFLDKDGTLVHDAPYSVDVAHIRLMEGAVAGLGMLADAGYRLVVVSNQSGVARGAFTEADLEGVWSRLSALVEVAGPRLDGFFYCPHHPDGVVAALRRTCRCRKPAPGLLFRAAELLDIDLGASWMVGDILDDVEAGHRAGCRSVLVLSGGETVWRRGPGRMPDVVASGLEDAAVRILQHDRSLSLGAR